MTYNTSNNYYNRNLKKKASVLRKTATKSEVFLWKYVLSKKQMLGFTFNRQRPVLNYIADFLCKELKLIIEPDGITHMSLTAYNKDINGQNNLIKEGFTVIRFKDEEVLKNISGVKKEIEKVISTLVNKN